MAAHRVAVGAVGRDEELARIDSFLNGDEAGTSALALEGEAGIGKTTLWLAGVERARERGLRVLVARPAEAERELSFATLGDLLSDVGDRIRTLPAPQRRPLARALLQEDARGVPVDPRAVAVALVATLKAMARDQPLLVAIDDVQWADAATAAALSFALRRAVEEPVTALFARRTGHGVALSGMTLDPMLGAEHVVVGPLSLGAIRRLLRDRLDATFARPILRRIHERSGGNPFFALELARALSMRGGLVSIHDELPVPEDLERLVGDRLHALPVELREPLATVAALGEPTLALVDLGLLEPAFAAGVLVLEGERVRFEHPLLAAAAYSALPPQRRRALHRRLAGLVDDESRARHLALGAEGPDPGLAAMLDAAALQARLRGAPDAAAELAELALELGGDDDPDAAARRIATAAEYRIVAGDVERARTMLDAALAVGTVGSARSRLLLQRARFAGDPVDESIAWLHEALSGAVGHPALEAEIALTLAQATTNLRRLSDAEPYARRALDLAEHVDDPTLLARALFALGHNQFWRGRGFPAALMERALELDPLCESLPVSARPITQFAFTCIFAGDLDRARGLLERARRIGYERADSSVHVVLWNLTTLDWLTEDWNRALELAHEICELGADTEYDSIIATGFGGCAVIHAHLGDEELARRFAAEAAALEPRPDSRAALLRGFALAPIELALDRPRAALELARADTLEARARGVEEPAQLALFPIYAEAAIACGELDEAEELLDWIEERAVRVDRAWALACAARCHGLLTAAHGDEAAALAAFERALREHARVQYRRFDLARTLLAQGETLRRFRKKRASREAMESAIAIFDELGAKLWSTKARRELARVSGRARTDGLTETEHRVAELVASGRSNKEIAGELFVTVRTVETHLTKIYAKLGVRSRTELVSRLPL